MEAITWHPTFQGSFYVVILGWKSHRDSRLFEFRSVVWVLGVIQFRGNEPATQKSCLLWLRDAVLLWTAASASKSLLTHILRPISGMRLACIVLFLR